MTQLPEVEVLRKDLEREIVGKRVKEVTVRTPALVRRHRTRPDFAKALEGRKISAVARRGMRLLIELDDATTLVVLLGSGATMTRETAGLAPGRDTHMVATFTTGGSLHYSDPAKDGELFVVPTSAVTGLPELALPGIDPLADTFTWHAYSQRLEAGKRSLKTLLVDPSFVVGLGDVYADEILWAAGLSGERISNTLSSQEVRRLYRATLEVVYEAVRQGGTADPDSRSLEESGDYGDLLKVYGREGLPCSRCRQAVRRKQLDDDTFSYFCPQCQT